MLARPGCDTELARDGDEAIDLYKKAIESDKPFDAVILDLTVQGGMGGKEAVWRLKAIDSEVNEILPASYPNNPGNDEFQEYGFTGHYPSPL